jgi:hypothetical protein
MMIPDLPFSVLCEDVRQETTGRFLFLGVFNDGVAVRRLPVRFVKLCIASRWACGDGSFKQRTRIVAPDGVTPVVEGKELDVRLASTEATQTNIETFLGVAFREAGVHWVEISLDGELRLRYPFSVRVAQPDAR